MTNRSTIDTFINGLVIAGAMLSALAVLAVMIVLTGY